MVTFVLFCILNEHYVTSWQLKIFHCHCHCHIYVGKVIKKLDINTQPFGKKLCLDMAMGFAGGRGQILPVCSLHARWGFVITASRSKQQGNMQYSHSSVCDDIIAQDRFPYYWPFVQGIHRLRYPPTSSNAGLICFFIASLNKFLSKQSEAKQNLYDLTQHINTDSTLKIYTICIQFLVWSR